MRITGEGWRFVLATFLVGIAALNTGNNLMYMIFAMMLSILAVSILALLINLRRLSLDVSADAPVFAGRESYLTVTLKNGKLRLPSYSIKVRPPEGFQGEGRFAKVKPAASATEGVRMVFKKRGVYSYGDFVLETGFPFIFLTRRVRIPVRGEVTVYPELIEVGEVARVAAHGEEAATSKAGPGEDLLTIREFMHGDDVKRIHWKASAKADKLMVREFSVEEPRRYSIILDNIRPFEERSFEKAVSFAASAARVLIYEGYLVRLMTCRTFVPFGGGAEHLYKILDTLAAVSEEDRWDCPLEEEILGGSILVLKSGESALRRLEHKCDMAVYADSL